MVMKWETLSRVHTTRECSHSLSFIPTPPNPSLNPWRTEATGTELGGSCLPCQYIHDHHDHHDRHSFHTDLARTRQHIPPSIPFSPSSTFFVSLAHHARPFEKWSGLVSWS